MMTEGKYMCFRLAQQDYAIPVASVREIIQMAPITSIPQTESYIRGVINLRGKIIPVIDLLARLGLGEATMSRESCVIVLDGPEGQVGTIVDQVQDVLELTQSEIEPPSETSSHAFVSGFGKKDKRLLVLIDVGTVLKSPGLSKQLETAA